jgi:hypothetical protein
MQVSSGFEILCTDAAVMVGELWYRVISDAAHVRTKDLGL